MCLAIPGQTVDVNDEANRLLDGDGGGAHPGDWVLTHVVPSNVDETEAAEPTSTPPA
jgi:hydrogenase maturation factor